jgi:hypothetical protein
MNSENIGKVLYVESYFSFRPVRRAMDGRSTISLDQLVDILPHHLYPSTFHERTP